MTSFELVLIVVIVYNFARLENCIERSKPKSLPPPFIPPEDNWPPPALPYRKPQPGEKTLGDLLQEAMTNCP